MQAYRAMHKSDLTKEEEEELSRYQRIRGEYKKPVYRTERDNFGRTTQRVTGYQDLSESETARVKALQDKKAEQDKRHRLYGQYAVSDSDIRALNKYIGKEGGDLPSLTEIQNLMSVDPESNAYTIPSITITDMASPDLTKDFGNSLYNELLKQSGKNTYRTSTNGGRTSNGTMKVSDILEAIGEDGKGIRKVSFTPYSLGATQSSKGKNLIVTLNNGKEIIVPADKFGTEIANIISDSGSQAIGTALDNMIFGSNGEDMWQSFTENFTPVGVQIANNFAKNKGYNFQQVQPKSAKE